MTENIEIDTIMPMLTKGDFRLCRVATMQEVGVVHIDPNDEIRVNIVIHKGNYDVFRRLALLMFDLDQGNVITNPNGECAVITGNVSGLDENEIVLTAIAAKGTVFVGKQ